MHQKLACALQPTSLLCNDAVASASVWNGKCDLDSNCALSTRFAVRALEGMHGHKNKLLNAWRFAVCSFNDAICTLHIIIIYDYNCYTNKKYANDLLP